MILNHAYAFSHFAFLNITAFFIFSGGQLYLWHFFKTQRSSDREFSEFFKTPQSFIPVCEQRKYSKHCIRLSNLIRLQYNQIKSIHIHSTSHQKKFLNI